jgi:hypothetical protein
MKGCRNCTNWQALDEFLDRIDPATRDQNAQIGLCRRYAPRPLTPDRLTGEAEPRWDTFWPRVASDDWCGEWDPNID